MEGAHQYAGPDPRRQLDLAAAVAGRRDGEGAGRARARRLRAEACQEVRSNPGTLRLPAMRVAAIYDIHGNLPALEAVLDDIRRAGVDHIVVGGDVVPGPMPREAFEVLLD